MARCLIAGLVKDGYPPAQLRAADPLPAQLRRLSGHCPTFADNHQAVSDAQVVVLAVKPQVMREVAIDLAPSLQHERPLVLSIAAGITSSALKRWLGAVCTVVRAMPNTPALVGSGASALYADPAVPAAERETAESILRAVGLTVWVGEEGLLDVVTAVSGSGPAYFFLLIELMEKVAVELGLTRECARLLTLQTAFGAAKMVLESTADAATLRAQVTSPGGTTEQAIRCLQDAGMEHLVRQAIAAAARRSTELANLFGEV